MSDRMLVDPVKAGAIMEELVTAPAIPRSRRYNLDVPHLRRSRDYLIVHSGIGMVSVSTTLDPRAVAKVLRSMASTLERGEHTEGESS